MAGNGVNNVEKRNWETCYCHWKALYTLRLYHCAKSLKPSPENIKDFTLNIFLCVLCYCNMFFLLQRPTAKELLKFSFIRKAKKNSYLVDLIDRYIKWRAQRNEESETESENSDS